MPPRLLSFDVPNMQSHLAPGCRVNVAGCQLAHLVSEPFGFCFLSGFFDVVAARSLKRARKIDLSRVAVVHEVGKQVG